jgi:methylmalonyl-CoA carboxyltransferase large subunit
MGKAIESDLAALLEQVQAQLAALSERMERLEGAKDIAAKPNGTPSPAVVKTEPARAAESVKAEITEEEVLAISAALAAYLGVRVHIRQIRLVSSHAWAQEGRVSIQASHRLHS